jgi:filamentous hemagglutinin
MNWRFWRNLLFLAFPAEACMAQLVADRGAPPGNRPIVGRAANGVPLVDIATPGKRGVSMNQYRQFDIGKSGVLLNNNRRPMAKTELAGWVPANPFLAGGEARLIVNQVNSAKPSLLQGPIEIAGQKAELAIANPAGLSIDGVVFLNAHRVSLAAGRSLWQNGGPAGFALDSGRIEIGGAGMDASRASHTAILARAVEINAQLHAQQLSLAMGQGVAGADGENPPVAATRNLQGMPAFALDVKALGGMHAGAIRLAGGEAGVGIRNQGAIQAEGSLALQADGKLINQGKLLAGEKLHAAVSGIENHGLAAAGQDFGIENAGVLANAGTLAAGGGLSVRSAAFANGKGAAAVAGGALALVAQEVDNAGGKILAGRLRIQAQSLANRDSGQVGAQGALEMESAAGLANQDGARIEAGSLRIHAGELANRGAGIFSAGDAWIAAKSGVRNEAGRIAAAGGLQVQALGLANEKGGGLAAGNLLAIQATNVVSNQASLWSGKGLSIETGKLQNLAAGRIEAEEKLSIDVRENLRNQAGLVSSGGALSLAAGRVLENSGGGRIVGGNAALAAQVLENRDSGILAGGNLSIQASQAIFNAKGEISAGDAQFWSPQIDNAGGLAAARGRLEIEAGRLENREGGRIYAEDMHLAAKALENQGDASAIAARGDMCLAADVLENRNHALAYAGGNLALGGFSGALAVRVANAGAGMEAGGDLSIAAQRLENRNLDFATHKVPCLEPGQCRQTPWLDGQAFRMAASARALPQVDWDAAEAAGRFSRKHNVLRFDGQKSGWWQFRFVRRVEEEQVLRSDPGRIVAGKDLRLSGGAVENDKSHLLAGQRLAIEAGTLRNLGYFGRVEIHDSGTAAQSSVKKKKKGPGKGRKQQQKWRETGYSDDLSFDFLLEQPLAANAAPSWSLPAAPQRPSGPAAALPGSPGFVLDPAYWAGALFRPASPGKGHWIETDPRFAEAKGYLSSDYFFKRQGQDPAMALKRLGDGFFEQRQIREQVLQLAGQRFLPGYADDEAQYRALMDAGLALAEAWQLRPGIGLSAAQQAALAEPVVWLVEMPVLMPDGRRVQALAPVAYLPQSMQKGAAAALLGGRDIQLSLDGKLENRGAILAQGGLLADADSVANAGRIEGKTVAVDAVQSLSNQGRIEASDAARLRAGQSLVLAATVSDNGIRQTKNPGGIVRLSEGATGALQLEAGESLALAGASIANEGQGGTQLLAGGDLSLGTIATGYRRDLQVKGGWRREREAVQEGAAIKTRGSLALVAGGSVRMEGARVESGGALAIEAGKDVALLAAQEVRSLENQVKETQNGGFSRGSQTQYWAGSSEAGRGSRLSGGTVGIEAGRDLRMEGAAVVALGGLALAAGGDAEVGVAQGKHDFRYESRSKKSGAFAKGLSVSIGKQSVSEKAQESGAQNLGSLLSSQEGSVQAAIRGTYRQSGSSLLAPRGNIAVEAQAIRIEAGKEDFSSLQETRAKQVGITAGLGGNALASAVQTVGNLARAAEKVDGTRMKALAAAGAGLEILANADEIQQGAEALALADPQKLKEAFRPNLGVGKSASKGKVHVAGERHAPSWIAAGGDVQLTAREHLEALGSRIEAGQDAVLAAGGKLLLQAVADTEQEVRTNKSSGMRVGMEIGLASGKEGASPQVAGLFAGAETQKGNGQGSRLAWQEAQARAGGALRLSAGGDAALRGAIVQGESVAAAVGGNLEIASLQDESHWRGKQKSANGMLSLALDAEGNPFGGAAHIGKGKSWGDWQSVQEQSGIFAGDGGFEVEAGGIASLSGGLLASSEAAIAEGKNRFSAAGLSVGNLENRAEAGAKNQGFGFDSDLFAKGKYGIAKTALGMAMDNGAARGKAAGRTQSAIAEGEIIIAGEASQAIAGLSRDTQSANRPVQEIGRKAVEEKAEAGQFIKKAVFDAAGKFSSQAYEAIAAEGKVYLVLGEEGVDKRYPVENPVAALAEQKAAGKGIKVFTNGINNETDVAGKYAWQMAGDGSYLLNFPYSGNALSELMVAGYQKFLEGDFFGLSGTAKLAKELTLELGMGMGMDWRAHSRGSLTVKNMLDSIVKERAMDRGDYNVQVNFYGPAANKQATEALLSSLNGKESKIGLETHKDDFVGIVIGGNEATHDKRPAESSKLNEWITLIGDPPTVHSCYGDGKPGCARYGFPEGRLENDKYIQE